MTRLLKRESGFWYSISKLRSGYFSQQRIKKFINNKYKQKTTCTLTTCSYSTSRHSGIRKYQPKTKQQDMPRPKRKSPPTTAASVEHDSNINKNNMKNTAIINKFATRPGIDAGIRLVSSIINVDNNNKNKNEHIITVWEQIESKYIEMLQEKGSKELLELDTYCEDVIGKRLQDYIDSTNSNNKLFTLNDLLKIVQWKFLKGKSRPMLYKYIKSNTDNDINTAVCKAITLLSNIDIVNNNNSSTNNNQYEEEIRTSIEYISNLKGVGPATASAILSLYKPELFIFMDDEIIETLDTTKKRSYTIPTYMLINNQCIVLSQQLNNLVNASSSDKNEQHTQQYWSPRRVGKAIWTITKLVSSTKSSDYTDFLKTTLYTIDSNNGSIIVESSNNDSDEEEDEEECTKIAAQTSLSTKKSKR